MKLSQFNNDLECFNGFYFMLHWFKVNHVHFQTFASS